jgi:hypothetical protein
MSISSGLVQIGKEEGIMGYFKGNGTNVQLLFIHTHTQLDRSHRTIHCSTVCFVREIQTMDIRIQWWKYFNYTTTVNMRWFSRYDQCTRFVPT